MKITVQALIAVVWKAYTNTTLRNGIVQLVTVNKKLCLVTQSY